MVNSAFRASGVRMTSTISETSAPDLKAEARRADVDEGRVGPVVRPNVVGHHHAGSARAADKESGLDQIGNHDDALEQIAHRSKGGIVLHGVQRGDGLVDEQFFVAVLRPGRGLNEGAHKEDKQGGDQKAFYGVTSP